MNSVNVLIFSLGRLDVFSKGDGGLARAINNLYGKGAKMTAKGDNNRSGGYIIQHLEDN